MRMERSGFCEPVVRRTIIDGPARRPRRPARPRDPSHCRRSTRVAHRAARRAAARPRPRTPRSSAACDRARRRRRRARRRAAGHHPERRLPRRRVWRASPRGTRARADDSPRPAPRSSAADVDLVLPELAGHLGRIGEPLPGGVSMQPTTKPLDRPDRIDGGTLMTPTRRPAAAATSQIVGARRSRAFARPRFVAVRGEAPERVECRGRRDSDPSSTTTTRAA